MRSAQPSTSLLTSEDLTDEDLRIFVTGKIKSYENSRRSLIRRVILDRRSLESRILGRCLLQKILGRELFRWQIATIAFQEERRAKWCLIIAPPGHGKTTVTVNGILYEIVNVPDTRIGIGARVDAVAIGISNEAKTHVEQNEDFNWIFADKLGSIQGGTTSWTIGARKKISREPTVGCMSLRGQVLSWHWDMIFNSDLMQPEDMRTAMQRQHTFEAFYGKLATRVDVGTSFWTEGVHINPYDLFVKMRSDPRLRGNVKVFPALPQKGTWDYETFGPALCPELYDVRDIVQMEQSLGPIIFDPQYQGDPRAQEGRVIPPHYFRFYEEPPPREKLAVFSYVDLAASLSDQADYFAIVTVGIENFEKKRNEWKVYVLRTYFARIEWAEQVEAVQKVNVLDKPRRIFIESNGYQLVMAQEQIRRGMKNVRKIRRKIDKVSYVNKYLAPKMKNHQVFFKREQQELIGELEDFPDGEHDDLVDCLAGCIHGAERQVRVVNV